MSVTIEPCQFRLPDLLASCPLNDSTNPHYESVVVESQKWATGLYTFTSKKEEIFVKGYNELLCSHVYPYADHEHLRLACDFINLLFIVDDCTDEQSGSEASITCGIFADAMTGSGTDDGTSLSKITKEFRARFLRLAHQKTITRFDQLCKDYATAVAQEAMLRQNETILESRDYIPLRRNNSAVLLCFALVECMLGVGLDDRVYSDENFDKAYLAACDHVCWANDVYSYAVEKEKKICGNNIVTVLMNEHGRELQETVDRIGVRCAALAEEYVMAKAQLSPSLGADAKKFLDALGSWMTGNIVWSFETPRYFGRQTLNVKKDRMVYLNLQGTVESGSGPELDPN